MKTIAYQGAPGAFSHITAIRELGGDNWFVGTNTFQEMFELLEHGQADYAVIPIENSLIGCIYENYDLLTRYHTHIVAEHYTKISHCLLGVSQPGVSKEASIQALKKVLSHQKALEQCSHFFQSHPWIEPVQHADTAGAAEEISKRGDPAYAAIASAEAGQINKLELLKEGLEDDPENYTRFFIVSKRAEIIPNTDKCSLMIRLKHVPGSLSLALQLFADQHINLTKLESRPIRGSPFTYLFYLDFEFKGKDQSEIEALLTKLRHHTEEIKVLGFYKGGFPWTP